MKIENDYVPNFNAKIQMLSDKLSLPFINMNTEYFQNFTSNAINFY